MLASPSRVDSLVTETDIDLVGVLIRIANYSCQIICGKVQIRRDCNEYILRVLDILNLALDPGLRRTHNNIIN